MEKTYHVHVNGKAHLDTWAHPQGKSFPCCLVTKQMPKDWHGDSGCKYHVQLLWHKGNSTSGHTTLATCSELRLALYLVWMRLKGYRKSPEEEW